MADQPSISPSSASEGMKMARLVLNKLDKSLKNSYSYELPVLSLLEEFDSSSSSSEMAEPSTPCRMAEAAAVVAVEVEAELELEERENGGVKFEKLLNAAEFGEAKAEAEEVGVCEGCRGVREREKEVELREEKLTELRRKLVSNKKQAEKEFVACFKEVNLKREELAENRREQGEELRFILEQLKEKWNDLEVKEKEIKEGFVALESKERRVREGGKGCCCCNGARMEEERVDGVKLQALLSVTESKVDEQCRGMEVERDRVSEVELKEKEINACWKLLEMREDQINERVKGMEVVQKEVDDAWRAIRLKEEEMSEGFQALELKKKAMNVDRRRLELREKEVEVVQKGVDDAWRAVKSKEEEMSEGFRALELKKKAIDVDRRKLELREKELELSEKETKALELRVKDLEERFKGIKKRQCKALELRERELNEGLDDLETKTKKIADWGKEMEQKEEELSVRYQEVREREKRVDKRCRASDLREQSLNERCQAQASKEKITNEKSKDLFLKEKRLSERNQTLELIEKQVDQRCQSLKLQEQEISALCKAHELKEKELTENLKAMELKEKQLSRAGNLTDKNLEVQFHENEDQILRLCKAMSGKALQMFLNERFMEHRSMMESLCNALKLSNDPAKLVLSAVYRFFPPHLERPGSAFDTRAVRTSCIVLLEYLMNMNVVISEAVKNEAIKMANQWRDGLLAEGGTKIVALGFLLLLASYNLGSNFETRELQGLYEVIEQDRLAPQIGLRLGLSKAKNDAQADSKDRKKRSGSCIESPGQEKHRRINTDEIFVPYHPADAIYAPPADAAPFHYQYPVWPHGATPAACNCIPPYWCPWCLPVPYSYSHYPQ